MNEKQQLGKIGENIASEYLKKKGYLILERNFACRQGEIDIIAKDEKECYNRHMRRAPDDGI